MVTKKWDRVLWTMETKMLIYTMYLAYFWQLVHA